MAAEHHDLVLLVAARNLRDGVVGRTAFRIRPVDDVELELHRHAVGEDAGDAPVVLIAHHDGRQRLRHVVRAVLLRDDLPVLARRVVHTDARAARDEKLVDPPVQLVRRDRRRRLIVAAAAAELPGVRVGRVVLRAHLIVGAPFRRRREIDRHDRVPADEDDAPFDLVAGGVERRGQLRRRRPLGQQQLIRLRRDRSARTRRPRERLGCQRVLHRRHDVRGEALVHPSGVPEVPRLEVAAGEAPRRHLFDRPLACRFQARRSGDARPVHVGQHVQRVHDPRVGVLFRADLRVDVRVQARLGGERREQRDAGDQDGKASQHGRNPTAVNLRAAPRVYTKR